jgi:hypothetical protein
MSRRPWNFINIYLQWRASWDSSKCCPSILFSNEILLSRIKNPSSALSSKTSIKESKKVYPDR